MIDLITTVRPEALEGQHTHPTSQWLASIKSLSEAKILIDALPSLIDLKNPSAGALGALETTEVTKIVAWVKQNNLPSQTSATIGDLPMQADIIIPKLQAMAATGVDYLKIGLFPEAGLIQCLLDLTPTLHTLNTPVIAVLFADRYPVDVDLARLKQAGFQGAMIDTAIKNGQGLLHHWDKDQLAHFIKAAHRQSLLCGLAGALTLNDIEHLQPLGADYLGFRSALCDANIRTDSLNPQLIKHISRFFMA